MFEAPRQKKESGNTRRLHFLWLLDSKNEREHKIVASFEVSKTTKTSRNTIWLARRGAHLRALRYVCKVVLGERALPQQPLRHCAKDGDVRREQRLRQHVRSGASRPLALDFALALALAKTLSTILSLPFPCLFPVLSLS